MNAQELMIGNLVEYKGRVVYISEPHFVDRAFLRRINPIPITEEWLLKLGLEEWEKGYLDNKWLTMDAWPPGHPAQRFDLYWCEAEGFMTKSRYQEDHPHFYMPHIKHIHQLQNLFFSLTGNELEIKKEIEA